MSRRRQNALVLLGLASVLGASPVRSQTTAEKKSSSFTVSEYAYKKLEEAHTLLGKNQYGAVRKVLDDMLDHRGLKAHELALVYQTYGYLESAQGHHAKAAAHFEKCLAQDALPPAAQLDVEYNLAQLYIAGEQFEKGTAALKAWLAKVEKPPAHAYYLLAVAYAKQGRPDLALSQARRAVEQSSQPREAWLQLLLSLCLEQRDYTQAAATLERLLARFPKKTYWMQLSAVYGELKKDRESLAVMQLAYAQGLLNQDRELRTLAQMYLYQQIPYLAARVLEKGLAVKTITPDAEALALLADSWLNAREYRHALEPLERAAAMSDRGDLYVRLGQLYVEKEDWTKAVNALQHALAKPNLKDRGQALVLLGICHLSAKQYDAATRAFEQARRYDRSRKAAEQWLQHVERERAAS